MLRRLLLVVLALLLLGGLGWAALAPVQAFSREKLFEIPLGTSARRIAGEELEILPQTIRLGVNDVLVLRNADEAPHIFGPTLIMPGQAFRLPFAKAATYSFLCTAHTDGQLNVIVEPAPARGWARLRWRWRSLADKI
ncbi:hypothetical protein [Altererythrobacter sp. Root672]|uniref:cupredoxin domain-containing protein n=1 Tax=Altererythrobacter sp. Root672 TaxID=1736584 RepID=UPI0006F2FBEE|nr:hypothetical protein [Altererythrobacter sp. Root672]KRA83353.1 hypothetical protein ASD76_04670 [Altererythrobacter sp. Root672]